LVKSGSEPGGMVAGAPATSKRAADERLHVLIADTSARTATRNAPDVDPEVRARGVALMEQQAQPVLNRRSRLTPQALEWHAPPRLMSTTSPRRGFGLRKRTRPAALPAGRQALGRRLPSHVLAPPLLAAASPCPGAILTQSTLGRRPSGLRLRFCAFIRPPPLPRRPSVARRAAVRRR
jgi:hypothetical protein